MLRFAIFTFTLTALPWSGESFVSTISSSGTTAEGSNLDDFRGTINHREGPIQRGRRRLNIRQQRQLLCQQKLNQPLREPRKCFSSPTVSSLISFRRSSSMLNASMLSSGRMKESGRGRDSNRAAKKVPGWRRRILNKISFRRQRGGSESSSSLPSSTIEHQEAQKVAATTFVMYKQESENCDDDFVVRNFNLIIPDEVLPVVEIDENKLSPKPRSASPILASKVQEPSKTPVIDSEYFDVSITSARRTEGATQIESPSTELATKRSIPTNNRKGLICRYLENFLIERIGQRWTTEAPEGFKVDVRSSPDWYSNIRKLLFKGLFRANAILLSDRIVFPMIRFSSVRLQMHQVTLNLFGFFDLKSDEKNDSNNVNRNQNGSDNHNHHQIQRQNQQQMTERETGRRVNSTSNAKVTKNAGKIRYPKQFDIHVEDLTMSRHDLLFSPCIKNGLRQLLINLLKDRGIRSDSIRITSLDILRNGKIACIGEAKMHFPSGPPVRFEVRSGISFSKRGHVLTFPGLEVALNRDIGLFVPVHPTVDLDVGHNTKFHSIDIDGRQKLLKIAASVTITPDRTRLTQDYVQTSEAFSAMFFFDVGQWLTRLLRFSK